MSEEQDRASLFGAAVAVHRQLSTKLTRVDTREELWQYVQWLEGKCDAPDGDVSHTLKSMKIVEQMIKDNAL